MLKRLYKKIKQISWRIDKRQLTNKAISAVCKLFGWIPVKDIIIIQSQNDFDCNGGAIYDYLIKNGYNEKYKIVWILRNNNVPKDLPKNVVAYYDYSFDIRKVFYVAFSKYIFGDDAIARKARADQKRIYCTHGGIAIKDVRGKIDLKDSVDGVLSPSENFDRYMIKNYNIYNSVEMIHVGYPCQDIFYKDVPNEYYKVSNKNYKKTILWMPTFRKSRVGVIDSDVEMPLGIPLIVSLEEYKRLNRFLEKENVLLTIKLHPSQEPSTYKQLKSLSNIKVVSPELEHSLGINKYALMKDTDALISDYSAAAYEYLLLNRPIGFVMSDINEYKPGLIIDKVDMEKFIAGQKIKTYDDFVFFIKNIVNDKDEYYNERNFLKCFLYKYDDGNSTERLIKYLGI